MLQDNFSETKSVLEAQCSLNNYSFTLMNFTNSSCSYQNGHQGFNFLSIYLTCTISISRSLSFCLSLFLSFFLSFFLALIFIISLSFFLFIISLFPVVYLTFTFLSLLFSFFPSPLASHLWTKLVLVFNSTNGTKKYHFFMIPLICVDSWKAWGGHPYENILQGLP